MNYDTRFIVFPKVVFLVRIFQLAHSSWWWLTCECATLSRVRLLCTVYIHLSKSEVGTLVELPLGPTGGDCRVFFEQVPVPKTQTQ